MQSGRAATDPSENWYMDERRLYLYIILLAKKLNECRVLGFSSDEY
jgi:hypothetical protein